MQDRYPHHRARIVQEEDLGAPCRASVIGLCLGIAVTVPALFFAILSTGGGHGSYNYALSLYPISIVLLMLGNTLQGGFAAACVAMAVAWALIQFPLYGTVLGYYAQVSPRRFLVAAATIALAHLPGIVLCCR